MSTDAMRRAARTALQTFISTFLLLTVMPHTSPGVIPTWDGLKVATLAALWSAVTATLTLLQNALEDSTSFPALFGTKVSVMQKGAPTTKTADPAHVVEHVVSVAPVQVTVQQVLPDATAAEVSKVVEKQVSTVLSRAAQLPPNAGTTTNPTAGETLPAPPIEPPPAPVEPPVVTATP